MRRPGTTLSLEHEKILLDAVSDLVGRKAARHAFDEALLSLLEHVSGFELLTGADIKECTRYFWCMYRHDQVHSGCEDVPNELDGRTATE
jgi:hypothetical protein